ncbi:MAG: CPBP family intramembrane metalloprotease [Candidatus Zixiibacteriota bacterium]|nr:MAG: CPBP family intramembrane metalloprotease [candidate division Zixibacteria bacterium]
MQETKRSFRQQVEQITGRPLFIVTVIILSLLLSIFAGQLGTLLFYIVVFITLWARRWDWPYFGMTGPNWPKTVYVAFLSAIGIFIVNDFLVQPLIEFYFDKIDLSEFSQLEGSLPNYVLFILLGWILGGFCEEIIYRGYVLKRLAVIFGNTNKAWLLSAIIASIVFGFAHGYQGPSGIIATGMIALLFGIIFIFNKNNLMVLVLTHGIYNTIAITLIYLGKARMITDWVHEFLK